jgi:hypothetical protein
LTRFVSRHVPRSSLDGLCFGAPVNQDEEREGRNVYHFRPGQIFGVFWWRRYPEDRQHRAVAIVQALGNDQTGHELPSIHSAVAVHAIVDQHGPAGQDGAVDLLLDLIEDLKLRGQEPEQMPPSYWTEAVHHILLHPTLSDSPFGERIPCAS